MNSMTYELQADDYIDFQLYYYKHSKHGQNTLKKARWIMAVTYIIGLGVLYAISDSLFVKIFSMVLFLIFGIHQIWTYDKRQQKRIIKTVLRMISNGQADATLGVKTIDIQEGQLIYTERSGEQRIKRFKSIGETERCYFLFKDDIAAYIVPKRAFTSLEAGKAFVAEIEGLL